MKRTGLILSGLIMLFSLAAFGQNTEKLVSSKSHIKFFSHTPVEDIEANNNAAVGVIYPKTGKVVYSVPMQGFEFEKSLMQKHFNSSNFLDTQKFPKGKLNGTITNLNEINFSKDGTYSAVVEGDLTIKGVTKPVKEKGTVTIKGNKVEVSSKFNVVLADFGITFKKGKPSTNIAKEVEVSLQSELSGE